MTPCRQKIARDAVNECLTLLYARASNCATAKPTIKELNMILEKLGAARAALTDHLWDKQGG